MRAALFRQMALVFCLMMSLSAFASDNGVLNPQLDLNKLNLPEQTLINIEVVAAALAQTLQNNGAGSIQLYQEVFPGPENLAKLRREAIALITGMGLAEEIYDASVSLQAELDSQNISIFSEEIRETLDIEKLLEGIRVQKLAQQETEEREILHTLQRQQNRTAPAARQKDDNSRKSGYTKPHENPRIRPYQPPQFYPIPVKPHAPMPIPLPPRPPGNPKYG